MRTATRSVLALALALGVLSVGPRAAEGQHNVLLVIVDDLRPTLGAYDDEVAISPNFDAFFQQSVQFSNAHSSRAECAPSRASMLAGQRPDRTRVHNFRPVFRKYNKKLVTLPGHFRKAGYRVEGVGKLFDGRSFFSSSATIGANPFPDLCDDANTKKECSWDAGIRKQDFQLNTDDMCGNNGTEFFPGSGEDPLERHTFLSYSFPDELEAKDEDYCAITVAIRALQKLANADEPFFLAVGISKPHMPWVRPDSITAQYLDMPDSLFEPPSYDDEYWLDTHVRWSQAPSNELQSYLDYASVSGANRTRAYYGAVTFVDAQFGRLMTALDSMDVAANTHVVVWGDHGFHLGDRDLWGKKTVFDQATRVPLGVRPASTWLVDNQDVADAGIGAQVMSPVDSVDILPTLLDLCALELPKVTDRAGTSLVPLMRDPSSAVRAAAISQYDAYSTRNKMGYSIRSTNYRLVVYVPKRKVYSRKRNVLPYKKNAFVTSRLALYHYTSAGQIELVNHIDDPAHAHAKTALLQLFRDNVDRDWTNLLGEIPFDHPSR
ncbi:Iduronate 2-sulfatase [Hondaea fermentalgiana]|uniref:Iduronate 2-sulfatase n=1 Tax=Hondaea fermentalgiana TaxID=2315210 RepID=A0A2R5GK16_9STRA|nr:Iduronate 2-sulfatase [Hondaea fermentalgiana]|eukprot:GBG31217.1 Iduronate 2-sulfatase [Hondaea fermentalgiana]